MRLIHLLADLPKSFSPLAETNISSFSSPNGVDIIFAFEGDEDIIKDLKTDISNLEDDLKKLEKEKKELEDKRDDLEKKLGEKNELLESYTISPTDTIADLSERNEWQEKKITEQQIALRSYLERFRDFEKEIETLRARKNKASVKRCLKTGKLIATFQNTEYVMEPKKD